MKNIALSLVVVLVAALFLFGPCALSENMVIAAGEGDLNAVKRALALGVDVNAQFDSMETALDAAAGGNHKEVVLYLLSHGADPCVGPESRPSHLTTDPELRRILRKLEQERGCWPVR